MVLRQRPLFKKIDHAFMRMQLNNNIRISHGILTILLIKMTIFNLLLL
ncbi:hypothetical protein GJA_3728 [Janthinobacterium agaricidamnosum NBRC 102515 = DSM 9628]|uniref:Uncharacterized protein n=1 Tax=Janthinobacterium agaricidamnosum NBRC 102515 = DSM 9628 TaxID=1349767 RepID=W0VAF6_9BURK|nr:hypothetical protein GJA_3728 [Janthinobacterium agaricidamnosum NBRC 102515 = DSM 9628]